MRFSENTKNSKTPKAKRSKSFDKKESFVDFKIYNNDGSKAETCINGTLCLAWHLMQKHQIASIKQWCLPIFIFAPYFDLFNLSFIVTIWLLRFKYLIVDK